MTEFEAEKMNGGLMEVDEQEPTIFDESDLQASLDWRAKGAVNAVKNQGRCGSCWAFAGTASVESNHYILTDKLVNLSEQQLVDCEPKSRGCDGGYNGAVFRYLMETPQVKQS